MFRPPASLRGGDAFASRHTQWLPLCAALFPPALDGASSGSGVASAELCPDFTDFLVDSLSLEFVSNQRHGQSRRVISCSSSWHVFSLAHYIIRITYLCQDEFINLRIVIQRVKKARVEVEGDITGAIDTGLLVFVAISKNDTPQDADYLTGRLLALRIFPDSQGKLNRNVSDAGGELLIVPNFTLYGDCRKGRRPGFEQAARSCWISAG